MKKLLFLVSLIIISLIGAIAQPKQNFQKKSGNPSTKTIQISASDILYWVGTGSHQAIFIVSWDESLPNQSMAWGYRWNGSKTVAEMLTEITTTDTRITITGIASGFIDDISYSDENHNLSTELYWCYTVNGSWTGGVSSQMIADNDIIEFSDGCEFTATAATPVPDPNSVGNDSIYTDATIASSDIIYWTGTGNNKVILAVNWNNPNIALAWGYRFNEDSITVKTLLDSLAFHDPRMNYTTNTYSVNDITYSDSMLSLSLTGDYWLYNINSIGAQHGYNAQYIRNNDFIKWGDISCATVTDSTYIEDPTFGGYYNYSYVWTTPITAVSIPTEEPEEPYVPVITPDEIIYWVGEGNHSAVLTLNWVVNQSQEQYIGLAWGYKWNAADKKTIAQMIEEIATADPRLILHMNDSSVNNITFQDSNYNLTFITERSCMYSVNGLFSSSHCNLDTLENNDLVTYGDSYCASYDPEGNNTYWKEFTTIPVMIPNRQLFCGIVGTEGCTAIHYEDNRIKGWATGCSVIRGYQDIAIADSYASYGTEENAIGAVSESMAKTVSLGDGGMATLTFATPITNGEGFDFAIYENSFDDYFLELAFVEVSSDGVHFVRFPATSYTNTVQQIGTHGQINATHINNLAGKYRASWGTPFDLDELKDSVNIDVNKITHVRIIDVIGTINPEYASYDRHGNIINDPYPTNFESGGFDLSGVAVLHTKAGIQTQYPPSQISLYPNPCKEYIHIKNVHEPVTILMYNTMGQVVRKEKLTPSYNIIHVQDLPSGIYLLQIGNSRYKICKQ